MGLDWGPVLPYRQQSLLLLYGFPILPWIPKLPAPKNGLVEVQTYVPGGDQLNKKEWRGRKYPRVLGKSVTCQPEEHSSVVFVLDAKQPQPFLGASSMVIHGHLWISLLC